MDCPHCHHQNADGSRFGGACGSSLKVFAHDIHLMPPVP
jgi:hypothetical protein